MDINRQTRVTYLLQQPRFQSWFQSPRSEALVVDGYEFGAEQELSSMSYFCAVLHQMVAAMPQVQQCVPLVFFCGQHQWSDDHLNGPCGLIRSLIYYILAAQGHRIDLSFVTYGSLELMRSFDFAALCTLLRDIVFSLSRVTIICLIDSVSLFESEMRKESMIPLVRFL